MIACLFKRGPVWYAKIQLDAWAKPKRISLATSDKRVANVRLEKRVKDFEHMDVGLLAPLSARKASLQGLDGLGEAFLSDMESRDKAFHTVRKYRTALKGVRTQTGWTHLAHVTEPAFREWLRESTFRAKTRNDYLAVWRRFFRWMKRERLVLENVCEFIDPVDTHKTAREYRRALTAEEALRLLSAAPQPRRTIYRVMLETGLRAGELRKLRVADFNLGLVIPSPAGNEADWGQGVLPPRDGLGRPGPLPGVGASVSVPASIAKNRKSVLIGLSSETARELHAIIPARRSPFEYALRGLVPKNRTFVKDCAAVGIHATDATGRAIHLHSLRKTFGVQLVLAKADYRVVMEAMRHSDLKLTMKTYMDAAQLEGPVGAAVASLPWHRNEPPAKAVFA